MNERALHVLPLWQVADRIHKREVGPVELTQRLLDRAERLNPTLNAFITLTPEEALASARAAEDELAAGRDRGPLHGVPIALKDLVATAGVRTTAASKILSDWVPDEDATVVRLLKEAGAVILGKLNMHELACGGTSASPHFGPVHNPWNTDCISGGSSGGSGAAVAAGLCFGALGSDTGGSIRIPSALCGIVGLKPTYGRVSLHGVVPLAWTLDHVGPMARSARDCALVLQAIAGPDARDPSTAQEPVPDFAAALDGSAKGLRVGVPRNFTFDRLDEELGSLMRQTLAAEGAANPDQEVAELFEKALQTLSAAGAEVRDVDLPQLDNFAACNTLILISEAAAYHFRNYRDRPQDYGDDVRQTLSLAEHIEGSQHAFAARRRDEARREADSLLAGLDVLATPTCPVAAVPIASLPNALRPMELIRYTSAFDLTGQPTASVPCGLTAKGLPVGLQFVGRRFDEATVLRAAHAYETARGPFPSPPVEAT
jgi:aspartyl-tRNA(Asn)/glutamyl-tRNA(Gln) amidotransferase subunit A